MSAALAVVDEVGIDALTIRAVADAANAPPMSLYKHFARKEDLLDLMYADVARRMYADAGHSTWQEELSALARQVRDVLKEHPRWAPLLSRPAPPMTVPVRERLLKLMTNDGMTEERALTAFSSTVLVSIGLVLVDLSLRAPDGQSSIAKRFDRLRDWVGTSTDAEHAVTRSAFSKVGRFDLEAHVSLAVSTLIAGIEATRSKP